MGAAGETMEAGQLRLCNGERSSLVASTTHITRPRVSPPYLAYSAVCVGSI